MKNKDIQNLIDKYLEGETSPLEEQQLSLALNDSQDLTEEQQAILLMLGDLTISEAEYDALMEKAKDKPSPTLMALHIILSTAAIWLIGLFLYQQIPLPAQQNTTKEGLLYHSNSLMSGSTLKDVYTSSQHQDKLIRYTQFRQMIYENK